MIDIKKAEEEFKKYVSKYDMSESHISRKVYHTARVEELCEKIAVSLGMNQEETNLAKLIGLLHDVARFEQYTTYKTYDDMKSIDHGNLGVKILDKDNYIRKYIETDEYDDIIKKAIINHNKYSIESNLNEKEEIFCKIVRDADKLDIMFLSTVNSWVNKINEIEQQIVSPKVLEQFSSGAAINNNDIRCDLDRIIRRVAFIYDLNFKESYKIIKQNDYINKMINMFNYQKEETKKQMELIRKLANDYINKEI